MSIMKGDRRQFHSLLPPIAQQHLISAHHRAHLEAANAHDRAVIIDRAVATVKRHFPRHFN